MANDYASQIKKTGFVLENDIAESFKRKGWHTISNKYYEDDLQGTVREIDLVVYKVYKVQHVQMYTSLLISCKKSEENIWALLARPRDNRAPKNSDWWPLHAWSNDIAVSHKLSQPDTAESYHQRNKNRQALEILKAPDLEVFAFQEMSKANGSPKNDTHIFQAITSLIKAQAYELGALPQRKKIPCAYQFNLLSIIDSELHRLVFSKGNIAQEQVESELYISRYIIKKAETFSRIRFATASALNKIIEEYDQLHLENCKWFSEAIDDFFKDVAADYSKINLLLPPFRKEVQWPIWTAVIGLGGANFSQDTLDLTWDKDLNRLVLSFNGIKPFIDQLNANKKLNSKIKKALEKILRYSGDFVFGEDFIPF